jgi:hypothetical protein
MPAPVRSRLVAAAIGVAALAAIALLLAPRALTGRVAARLHAEARERSWSMSWRRLSYAPPLGFRLRGLQVLASDGDTLCRLDSLIVALDPLAALALHPRPRSMELAHAWFHLRARAATDADTLAPEEESSARRSSRPDRSARVRNQASEVVRILLLPARQLPRLELRDVELHAGADETPSLRLERLSLAPLRSGVRLAANGVLESEQHVPFDLHFTYDDADRLTGEARFEIPDSTRGIREPLDLTLAGRVVQDRRRGVVVLEDSSQVRLGRLAFRLAGRLERAGPRFAARLDAVGLRPAEIADDLPHSLLGPLTEVAVRGSFDYHAAFDLDFARPDSVRLEADVVPHGLALDPSANRLPLTSLAGPFVAAIHLPHDRIVLRELSSANPHFLPLDRIDSLLVGAVVTNEDGGFFRHRGFNLDAVRSSIAENIHAAAWRRGAGTITMQLVRNLYLGHARTLSRKGQEVVLTWLIEHLSGLDKRRMLEIYLNIIEWGPDVLGADEASHYYFGHDATRLTVPEALFMATVLPSPAKWRWRFTPEGRLRDFERAQMHFIGRAMIAKGWLAPDQLPETDALDVELAGAARDVLTGARVIAPPDSLPDSASETPP